MKEETNKNLNKYRQFEGKSILILCSNGFKFKTNNLLVLDENSISFNDKFQNKVLLSIDQILSITEVNKDA